MLSLAEMTNGLTPEHDFFFEKKPADPEMRESTSLWVFEEGGALGIPRIGIEGEAQSWDDRAYQANFALGGGRIVDAGGRGPGPSPFDADGRPAVFGAGPLTFRCIEPFRRWSMTFDGSGADGTVEQQISGTFDRSRRVPIRLDLDLEMVTPAWIHDYSAHRVARMTEQERAEAQSMGFGWRLEHMFRGKGRLEVDGGMREFSAIGSRIKRQSVRPLGNFRGHCWQAALFPDGRAFGFITYPPAGDGTAPYNTGYVYQGGKMYPARATRIPWLTELLPEGDDVSFEVESEVGTIAVAGRTKLTTFRVMGKKDGAPMEFHLHQGGAEYTWDGVRTHGMIERSRVQD